MKGKTLNKIAAFATIILVGATLGLTVLQCGDSNELVLGSAFLGTITWTDATGEIMGGSDEDWCYRYIGPDEISLFPAYPNPTNGTIVIGFFLPHACHVKISIHNVYKGHVETLLDEDLEPGIRSVQWDSRPYNSGLYWCYMWAEDFECKGRILVLK